MSEDTQPDAPDEGQASPREAKPDRTGTARKARWRRANPAKHAQAVARWRSRHARKYRQDQARRMAARRTASRLDKGEA